MAKENNNIVIFGASGDLTKRKLIPAFYHLYANGMMPENFSILGVSRTEYSDDAFREKLSAFLKANEKVNEETLERFCQHLYYLPLDPLIRQITTNWLFVWMRSVKSTTPGTITFTIWRHRQAFTA